MLLLASCQQEAPTDATIPANEATEVEAIGSDPKWEEVLAASRAMEQELESVFKQYGFKRDRRIEEHPSEAFSYTHIYTSESATPADAEVINARIRRVSPLYHDEWGGEGWKSVNLEWMEYDRRNPDGVGDLVSAVSITSDGLAQFDIEGRQFVAIRVFHNLTYPEYTYSFIDPDQIIEQASGKTHFWNVFPLGKETGPTIDSVKSEILARGYREGTLGPWRTFELSKIVVAFCDESEYKITGPQGEQSIVPIERTLGTKPRLDRPVVILRVVRPAHD